MPDNKSRQAICDARADYSRDVHKHRSGVMKDSIAEDLEGLSRIALMIKSTAAIASSVAARSNWGDKRPSAEHLQTVLTESLDLAFGATQWAVIKAYVDAEG